MRPFRTMTPELYECGEPSHEQSEPKSMAHTAFNEPIIFSRETHLVRMPSNSIILPFALLVLLSLNFVRSYVELPLFVDLTILCFYYSLWGALYPFLLPCPKKLYALMVRMPDTNSKKLPVTLSEWVIDLIGIFMLLKLLEYAICFLDWEVPYFVADMMIGLMSCYFVWEILPPACNVDDKIGCRFLLIVLVCECCSNIFDLRERWFVFVGVFIICPRLIIPKTLVIFLKMIKGKISEFLDSLRGQNREGKPLADSDSTTNGRYQSSLLFSNSRETSAREASKGAWMVEGVHSSVNSTRRISSPNANAKRLRETFFVDLLHIFLVLSLLFPVSVIDLEEDHLPTFFRVIFSISVGLEVLVFFMVSRTAYSKWKTIMVPKIKKIGIYLEKKGIISDFLEFYWTKIRACQSRLVSSNSERTNARGATQGACMREGELSLVDSVTRISSTDFHAPENRAVLVRACPSSPDSSEQKPSVAFDATNDRACQRDVLVSDLEEKNMPESVVSLVDLATRVSTPDFDALDNSGPIVSNMEKKDMREGLNRECLSKRVLSLDDSGKQKQLQEVDATKNRAHLVRAYQRIWITKSVLGLEDRRRHSGGRRDDAGKSFGAIYDRGIHTTDSLSVKSLEVVETPLTWEQPKVSAHLLSPERLTLEGGVEEEKSPDLLGVMLIDRVEQRVTKLPGYLGGLTAQSASSSGWPIGLRDGTHIVLLDPLEKSTENETRVAKADLCSLNVSLQEMKNVRITLKRKCRTMSVTFEIHQELFGRRCEGAVKTFCVTRTCRKHQLNQLSTLKSIHKQHKIRQWPCHHQSAISLPDGGQILYLSEKRIIRKASKRQCRSMFVLSLEDQKQHVDRNWEDAAKGHCAKRICRQLMIRRLSTAKGIHKQHGIHRWPFLQSTISIPDGGRILLLSEKKIVRKTTKRRCRRMSILSLLHCQQHLDRRRADAVRNIGAKRICRQLVVHHESIAKRFWRQRGIYRRWPFQQLCLTLDWATMKGYSSGDGPVEVISLFAHAELGSRLQLINKSWLGRSSPQLSALAVGEIGKPIALSLSESTATKNIGQRGGHDQSGSGASDSENERTKNIRQRRGHDQSSSAASDSENERTREQEEPEEIHTSTITKDDLKRLFGKMNREDAANILDVSVSTFKRKCREHRIDRWPHVRKKKGGRPPDQRGEGYISTTRKMPSHNMQTLTEGELVGQNQEARDTLINIANVIHQPHFMVGQNKDANECQRDFVAHQISLNPENGDFSEVACQVNDQSNMITHPNHDTHVFQQHQIASIQMRSDSKGGSVPLTASLASQGDSPFDGCVSRSSNLTFPACSILAAPSQPMASILHTMPTIRHMMSHLVVGSSETFQPEGQSTQHLNHTAPSDYMGGSLGWRNPEPSQEGPCLDRHVSRSSNFAFSPCSDQAAPTPHVEGQSMQSTVYSDHNALVFSQSQGVSPQEPFPDGYGIESIHSNEQTKHDALGCPQTQIRSMSSQNRRDALDWRSSLASQVVPFPDRLISGSCNWTLPTCSDQATPSQHVGAYQVDDQSNISSSHPNNNVLESQQPQRASIQLRSDSMSGSLSRGDSLPSHLEPLLHRHVFGSNNWAFATCSNLAASNLPVSHLTKGFPERFQVEAGRPWEPLDQLGKGNTSNSREIPSHNVQTGMEGELVGRNQEANQFPQNFMEGPITLKTPPFHDSCPVNYPSDNKGTEDAGGSSEGAYQVNDQSNMSAPNPNHNVIVLQQPQRPLIQVLSDSMGRSIVLGDSLTSQEESLSVRRVSGSNNLAFLLERLQVEGQLLQSTVCLDHHAFVPQPQIALRDVLTGIMRSFEDWRSRFSSVQELFEYINKTSHTRMVDIKAICSDNKMYIIKFPLTMGITRLKAEVSKRLKVVDDSFSVTYMDRCGDLINMDCDDDLMDHVFRSLGMDGIIVGVKEKDLNICKKCGSSM